MNLRRRVTKLVVAAIICLFAVAGAVPRAQATTYYVSPTGSDGNSGTSLSAPWQTVQHAFSSVAAGDTVEFRGGGYPASCSPTPCYSQALEASGTSTSVIMFTNYPGEVAIIQGDTKIGEYSGYSCVSTSTCAAYVTFQGTPTVGSGLVFEGSSADGNEDPVDVEGSHDVTFDHIEIRNGNYHAGLYQYGGYNISVLNSYIHDNGVAGSNVDHGIYWDQTSGGGNLIANCVIEHNAAQGIALYATSSSSQPSQVTVEENTIVNNGNYGINLYGSNNAIVNNVLLNNSEPTGNKQMRVGVATSGANFTINTNIMECTSTCGSGIYYANNDPVDVNTIESDPKFVDVTDHNYRLLCGSPAFTTQKSGYVQSTDKDGVSRSSTSALGAYVY